MICGCGKVELTINIIQSHKHDDKIVIINIQQIIAEIFQGRTEPNYRLTTIFRFNFALQKKNKLENKKNNVDKKNTWTAHM